MRLNKVLVNNAVLKKSNGSLAEENDSLKQENMALKEFKKKVIKFDKGPLNQKELKWEEEERDLIQEEML